MPLTVQEITESREETVSYDSPSAILRHKVIDGYLESAVHQAIRLVIPAFYRGLAFQDYHIKPLGNGVWDCETNYGLRQPREPGTVTIAFDIASEKQKVTHSLASAYFPAPGLPAIDFQRAVNVTKSGGTVKVDGADAPFRTFGFTITKTFGASNSGGIDHPLTGSQVQMLYEKAGCYNTDLISVSISGIALTFEPGTLFYHGATGSQKNGGNPLTWEGEVQLKFTHAPNLVGATVAGIAGINKLGWEYLWIMYEDAENTTAKILQPRPRQVCVEQMGETTDLMPLFS